MILEEKIELKPTPEVDQEEYEKPRALMTSVGC